MPIKRPSGAGPNAADMAKKRGAGPAQKQACQAQRRNRDRNRPYDHHPAAVAGAAVRPTLRRRARDRPQAQRPKQSNDENATQHDLAGAPQ